MLKIEVVKINYIILLGCRGVPFRTTQLFQWLGEAPMRRCCLYGVSKTNRSMRWRFWRRNISWRRTRRRTSWTRRVFSATLITPFLWSLRNASKMKRSSTLYFNIAQGVNYLVFSPLRISFLKSSNSFLSRTKFYAAQIFLALDALHQRNIIYREYFFIHLAWNLKMYSLIKPAILRLLTSVSPKLWTLKMRKLCLFAGHPSI